MTSATLDRFTIEPVEIQLPEACPACGQDFTEPSSLIEIGFMATHRTCRLVTDRGVQGVSEHETSDVVDELAFTTGYRCGGCRKVLALEVPRHQVAVAEKLGGRPGVAKVDGMIHPPASSAILTRLRESTRNVRAKGIAVRVGPIGVLDAGRDGWEAAPHIDGVSPIGAAILDAQPPGGVEWEQAAAMALGCDLAALEGISDGLATNEPSGVWSRSVAKANYRDGYLAGVSLRVELLAPTGALRVVS